MEKPAHAFPGVGLWQQWGFTQTMLRVFWLCCLGNCIHWRFLDTCKCQSLLNRCRSGTYRRSGCRGSLGFQHLYHTATIRKMSKQKENIYFTKCNCSTRAPRQTLVAPLVFLVFPTGEDPTRTFSHQAQPWCWDWQHSPCSGCILCTPQLAEHTSHITSLLAGELELTSDLKFPRDRWKKKQEGNIEYKKSLFLCV